MSSHIAVVSMLVIVVVVFCLCQKAREAKSEHKFTPEEEREGHQAIKVLRDTLDEGGEIQEVSNQELADLKDDIYMAILPSKEGLSYFPSANTRYWPQHYYSFPYNYKYGGAWPPGLFSRLYFWSPGFYTGSGLSYYMRPGMKFSYYPRNRWIRHTTNGDGKSYYYVSNRDDYLHDAADYTDKSFMFHS